MASASDARATQREDRLRPPSVPGPGLAVGGAAGCEAAASARRGPDTTIRRRFCEMPGSAAGARKQSAEILRGSKPSLTFLSRGGRARAETRSATDHQRLHGCRRRGCSQCLLATPVQSYGGERCRQRRYCPWLFHQSWNALRRRTIVRLEAPASRRLARNRSQAKAAYPPGRIQDRRAEHTARSRLLRDAVNSEGRTILYFCRIQA